MDAARPPLADWAATCEQLARTLDKHPVEAHAAALELAREIRAANTGTASCGMCALGGRLPYIDDSCPQHGDAPW